jgi:PadR family transcriptional regulator
MKRVAVANSCDADGDVGRRLPPKLDFSHNMRILSAMAPSVDTRTALLQALVEGDSYGLDLIQRVSRRTNGKVKIQQGRVYPVLRNLESEGLLESYDGDPMPERGGRPRRYYRLTAEGLRTAKEEAQAVYALLKPALRRV